jgi:L-amino acid N-acyltransferase YncA
VIRLATKSDRSCILKLYKAMFEEQLPFGGEVKPSEGTLKEMGTLFDAYVEGSLFGVVVVWCPEGEPQGVVMAGEFWDPPNFDTSLGKVAEGWGIYVAAGHRKQGVAKAMQEACQVELERLAFNTVISHVLLGNEAGAQNLRSHGWSPVATQYALTLKKEG